MQHVTVLKTEAVEALNISPGSLVVDATLGSGGHSRLIAEQIAPDGTLIALDADSSAIADNQSLTERRDVAVHLINQNFVELPTVLQSLSLSSVDGILADLGWRTEQFAGEAGLRRGFSFQADEPLLMTFGDPEQYTFTAYDIVNSWDEEHIADIIYGYGEERASRKIAREIVTARNEAVIDTAKQLAELIATVVRQPRGSKLHPATKTFQALRIAVNDELRVLKDFITASIACLAPRGRLAIITFHSLEDRIVKQTFKAYAHDQVGMVMTKKPITAGAEELSQNPRARSAKLRIFESV